MMCVDQECFTNQTTEVEKVYFATAFRKTEEPSVSWETRKYYRCNKKTTANKKKQTEMVQAQSGNYPGLTWTAKKFVEHCVATALAIIVLQHPGGPKSRMPFSVHDVSLLQALETAPSTMCFKRFLSSCCPPISSHRTWNKIDLL